MKNQQSIVPDDFKKLISLRVPFRTLVHARAIAKHNGMDLSSFIRQGLIRNIEIYVAESRR